MQKAINKKSERTAAYLFVVPAVVLLAAFLIYPALQTIRYAFTDYNIMRPDRIKFSGINNFIELFQDKNFWIAVKNTLHFTVLVVPFQTALALALALLISSRRRGVSIFRAAYFSPQVDMKIMEFIEVLGSLRNPQGSIPNFTSSAFKSPLSGLELYNTVQRIATTTIEVTWGLKYAARKMDTPLLLEEISSASKKLFLCHLARIEERDPVRHYDYGHPGDETVYTALCHDEGRAAEFHKDPCLLCV